MYSRLNKSVFSIPLISPQGEQLEPMFVVAFNESDALYQAKIGVAVNSYTPFNC